MAKRKPAVEKEVQEPVMPQDDENQSNVEPETESDDIQNIPEADKPTSMIGTTSTVAGRPEAICFNCKSFTPGIYGPRCMNRESPFFSARVDDNDTCERFTARQ